MFSPLNDLRDAQAARDPWNELRRRVLLTAMPALILACLGALAIQYPVFDPLDRVALPALITLFLTLFVLTWRRQASADVAGGVAYAGAALYFLLSINEQFRWYVGKYQHLNEATYWFSALYCVAFLTWTTRTALLVSGFTFFAALVVGGVNGVLLAGRGEFGIRAFAFVLQFYLSSFALIALLTSFSHIRQRLAETRIMAYADFLTGLPNRRYGEELLAQALGRGRVGVVLMDADHFKRVNDLYGHHVGDAVLRDLAQVVTATLRPPARLVRWGGEEFLIVAPGADTVTTLRIAEDARAAVAAHDFEDVRRVTLSAGVATRLHEESASDLLRRADTALYAAKHAGRDRVRVCEMHADAFVPDTRTDAESGALTVGAD
ncbi:GGDEF domain-containing protein [Deinococcus pimensis]|uniref:GGDEF domain-containing protein n=1 Tax=Deinococcus pimensis TaxID=309888 RepID=UPI0004AFF36E|nr:diguanylate cyclase [Deinococcus pimensis]